MSVKLNDNRGMTFIEVMVVLAVLGLLSHISMVSFLDYRRNAFNTRAIADGRHLATVISNSLVDDEDIDYDHAPEDGKNIGVLDNDGNPREKLLGLSEGVKARVRGNSSFYPGGQGFMEAYLYHENGTPDPFALSKKREYVCWVDELQGVITFSID